jgi:hypothetical protein
MSEREVIARALCRSRCRGQAHPCDQDNTGACLPEACSAWGVLWGDDADAILAALDAAGLAVVPKEPTQSMLIASVEYTSYAADRVYPEDCVNVYHAMLAAAKEGER